MSTVEERAEARAAYEAQEQALRKRIGKPFVDWTHAPDKAMEDIDWRAGESGRRSAAAQAHCDAEYDGWDRELEEWTL